MQRTFEQETRCNILLLEGLTAFGVKPFYNRDYCSHREKCPIYEIVEKHWKYSKPRPCQFNPKLSTCLVYHCLNMPRLLNSVNPLIQKR